MFGQVDVTEKTRENRKTSYVSFWRVVMRHFCSMTVPVPLLETREAEAARRKMPTVQKKSKDGLRNARKSVTRTHADLVESLREAIDIDTKT